MLLQPKVALRKCFSEKKPIDNSEYRYSKKISEQHLSFGDFLLKLFVVGTTQKRFIRDLEVLITSFHPFHRP